MILLHPGWTQLSTVVSSQSNLLLNKASTDLLCPSMYLIVKCRCVWIFRKQLASSSRKFAFKYKVIIKIIPLQERKELCSKASLLLPFFAHEKLLITAQFKLNAESTLNSYTALALNMKGEVGFKHLRRTAQRCFGMTTTYLNSFRSVQVPVGLAHQRAFQKRQLESILSFQFS